MKLSSFRLAPAKAKDRLTIILSIAAFALSAFNFYTTGLRVTDDIRVVAGEMPVALPNFVKSHPSPTPFRVQGRPPCRRVNASALTEPRPASRSLT